MGELESTRMLESSIYISLAAGEGDRDKKSNERTMQQINFVIFFLKK